MKTQRNIPVLILLFWFSGSSLKAQEDIPVDEPNLSYEQRLHEIFVKTQAEPISNEKWDALVGSRRSESYGIQAGDTLWDMSETFFGDGHYWPKLWAENGAIENPHQISPGRSIVFIAGTEAASPSIEVRDKAPEPVPEIPKYEEPGGGLPPIMINNMQTQTIGTAPAFVANAKEVDEEAASTVEPELQSAGEPEIPPPSVARKKLLRRLPPSFVSIEPASVAKYDSTGLLVVKRKAVEEKPIVTPGYYLGEGTPQNVGRIVEVETGDKVASKGQFVYVRTRAGIQTGEKFSILTPGDRIEIKKREVGPVVEVGGQIQIVESIDEKKNIYRAKVIESINPIVVGAMLSKDPLTRMAFGRTGPTSNVEVAIIGGQQNVSRKVMGPGTVIYLDGGANSGLKNGDILAVRSMRAARKESTNIPRFGLPVAVIKVIRVLNKVSTAVILEAAGEVSAGDLTGGPLPKLLAGIQAEEQTEQLAPVQDTDEKPPEEDYDEDDYLDD